MIRAIGSATTVLTDGDNRIRRGIERIGKGLSKVTNAPEKWEREGEREEEEEKRDNVARGANYDKSGTCSRARLNGAINGGKFVDAARSLKRGRIPGKIGIDGRHTSR